MAIDDESNQLQINPTAGEDVVEKRKIPNNCC
jgi:hypothetical protein